MLRSELEKGVRWELHVYFALNQCKRAGCIVPVWGINSNRIRQQKVYILGYQAQRVRRRSKHADHQSVDLTPAYTVHRSPVLRQPPQRQAERVAS